jgi:hypothetical protein
MKGVTGARVDLRAFKGRIDVGLIWFVSDEGAGASNAKETTWKRCGLYWGTGRL